VAEGAAAFGGSLYQSGNGPFLPSAEEMLAIWDNFPLVRLIDEGYGQTCAQRHYPKSGSSALNTPGSRLPPTSSNCCADHRPGDNRFPRKELRLKGIVDYDASNCRF
jgi:hypothetical protein